MNKNNNYLKEFKTRKSIALTIIILTAVTFCFAKPVGLENKSNIKYCDYKTVGQDALKMKIYYPLKFDPEHAKKLPAIVLFFGGDGNTEP